MNETLFERMKKPNEQLEAEIERLCDSLGGVLDIISDFRLGFAGGDLDPLKLTWRQKDEVQEAAATLAECLTASRVRKDRLPAPKTN